MMNADQLFLLWLAITGPLALDITQRPVNVKWGDDGLAVEFFDKENGHSDDPE